MYKKALNGEEKNVVGIDIPWNKPTSSHLIINRDDGISLEETVEKIISIIPNFRNLKK